MTTLEPHLEIINTIPTLMVDGHPFLIAGAQCDIWRSTHQDEKTVEFFRGYRDMNATAVSVGIPWSELEPEKDRYDFSFLNWFIQQAQQNDLKLIIHLFNTNVCGKVFEISYESKGYPQYTPSYILDNPHQYQRMILDNPYKKYCKGGPPMCPNDPRTLDREKRLAVRVAEHLKLNDRSHTVIMIQLNNEFYYQQWEVEGDHLPQDMRKTIRCQCSHCNAKYDPARYPTAEAFMFHSFADYVKVLSDAIAEVYDIPLYVNSPWWEPYITPIFLQTCPNLDLVGIDGVSTPCEPNMFSRCQLDRNIAFAAECPTENPQTKPNLMVLPYYVILKRQGIGNLLWEAPHPCTVVYDPKARDDYGRALYPIKHAMIPIARVRGTERWAGWYAVRDDFAIWDDMDIFGNLTPRKEPIKGTRDEFYIREGNREREEKSHAFQILLGDWILNIKDSQAGIVWSTTPEEIFVATPGAEIAIPSKTPLTAQFGRFTGEQWQSEQVSSMESDGQICLLHLPQPAVVRLIRRTS